MKKALYILGLFEDEKNELFLSLKIALKKENVSCECVETLSSGSFSDDFFDILKTSQRAVDTIKPDIIIAHSLGAYVLTYLHFSCHAVLLDPSLPVDEIVLPNVTTENDSTTYNDGINIVKLSENFVHSLKNVVPIDTLFRNKSLQGALIFGAKKGAHVLAEKYHEGIKESEYIFLESADHNFSRPEDQNVIEEKMKQRLSTGPSR